jgi:hypothetical protein
VSAESIINNPSPAFTEPCKACGVSEFQLGVRHAEERIIKLLEESECQGEDDWCGTIQLAIRLIKGEQK